MKWKTEFRGFLLFANNGTFLVTSALEEEVLPSRQWGSRRGCEWEVKGVQCQGEEGGQNALSLSHSKIWLFGAEPWFIPYGRERKKKQIEWWMKKIHINVQIQQQWCCLSTTHILLPKLPSWPLYLCIFFSVVSCISMHVFLSIYTILNNIIFPLLY